MQTDALENKSPVGFTSMILSVDWKEEFGSRTAIVRMDCRVCIATSDSIPDPVSWYTRASLDDYRSDYARHLTEKH